MGGVFKVAGAACVGAFTGWWATGLWQWAVESDERACEDSPSVCLTLYPPAGFGSWLVLASIVFFFALSLLDVRPRSATVPACVFLQTVSLAVLSLFSQHEYVELSAVALAVLGLGPALVAVCTIPGWRRVGATGIGALLATGLVTYFWAVS
ncbi:hypothetical protein [Streptomyces sp. NPDC090445]|uniref:hypothetical protein n=1 Tax=Streptomyces sp. NPDC090445 TaxID=3365963 RepID=UPI00381F0A0F